MESTGGKRREWWARNTLNDDFELLCPDGECWNVVFSPSRMEKSWTASDRNQAKVVLICEKQIYPRKTLIFPIGLNISLTKIHSYFFPTLGTRRDLPEYQTCNLGKVKANAIVTRGGDGYNEVQINAYINLFTYAQQYYGRKDADAFSFSMFYSLPPFYDLIFQDATQQLRSIPPEQRRYDLYLGGDFMRAKRITDCDAGAAAHKYAVTLAVIVPLIVTFTLTQY